MLSTSVPFALRWLSRAEVSRVTGDGRRPPTPVATVARMTTQQQKAERFLALHGGDQPLLLANPWDAGSAKALTTIGYQALATTSSGSAAALGRLDGSVTRDEALAHARMHRRRDRTPDQRRPRERLRRRARRGRAHDQLALGTGLAGGSVEDYDPWRHDL